MTTKEQYEAQVSGLQAQANAYAKHLGLTGAHNGEWDAFRHAYVSAEMTRAHGAFTAKLLGDMYEIKGQFGGQPWQEKNMDLWNNYAGRQIGSHSAGPNDTARRVKNALDSRSLITDPGHDGRQHGTGQPPPDDNDPKSCCDECGAGNTFPPPPPLPNPGDTGDTGDGQIIVLIPPMNMPPFDMPATAAASQGAPMMSGVSLAEPTTSAVAQAEATTSAAPQAELTISAEPLQASVDSAMALIAETRVEVSQVPALSVELEHVIDPMVSTWTDHHERDLAVVCGRRAAHDRR